MLTLDSMDFWNFNARFSKQSIKTVLDRESPFPCWNCFVQAVQRVAELLKSSKSYSSADELAVSNLNVKIKSFSVENKLSIHHQRPLSKEEKWTGYCIATVDNNLASATRQTE